MGRLLIVEPLPIAGVTASRGTGAANLLTADPKEVWVDVPSGVDAWFSVDLGAVRDIDTLFLGYVSQLSIGATWAIDVGTAGYGETLLLPLGTARVPDVSGRAARRSHALWHGAPVGTRYIRVFINPGAVVPPLTAGVLVIGRAFVAQLDKEWGSGRRPIDTGTATTLDSGGFAVVEGARKSAYIWTFGDLTIAEADQLDVIADALGSTRPALVVEDPDPTAGLVRRIHYGLFQRWRAYERRNRRQTRWELEIEQWT